jgi:hypothetical protein
MIRTRCSLEQKWVPEISPGGKDGRCVGLTTLPPSCAECLEILEPQPVGNLGVYLGLYRDSFMPYLLYSLRSISPNVRFSAQAAAKKTTLNNKQSKKKKKKEKEPVVRNFQVWQNGRLKKKKKKKKSKFGKII